MPILHIRNVPEELYERIRMQAKQDRRSITAETIALIERGLGCETQPFDIEAWLHRAEVLRAELREQGFEFDALAAIREDRDR